MYHNGKGNIVTVVYDGTSANRPLHNIRLEDSTKLDVHDSNLQLLGQLDFQTFLKLLSIIKTKLELVYR